MRAIKNPGPYGYRVLFGFVVLTAVIWLTVFTIIAVLFNLAVPSESKTDKAKTEQRHPTR